MAGGSGDEWSFQSSFSAEEMSRRDPALFQPGESVLECRFCVLWLKLHAPASALRLPMSMSTDSAELPVGEAEGGGCCERAEGASTSAGCTSARPATACLAHAAFQDDLETLRHLLGSKADPLKQDFWGRTPLFVAAVKGHLECCKLLLKTDASKALLMLKTKDNIRGETPLEAASRRPGTEIEDFLLTQWKETTTEPPPVVPAQAEQLPVRERYVHNIQNRLFQKLQKEHESHQEPSQLEALRQEQTKLSSLQERCAQLEKEKEDALRDEQTNLTNLQERCAQLEEEKDNALRDKQTKLTNLQDRCAQLEKEKEDALRDEQTQLATLQERCAQLQEEKEDALRDKQTILTNLQERCAQLEEEKEDALRDKQTKLTNLQERCAQLQREKEDTLRDEQTKLSNLQQRCAQLEEEKDDALRDKQTKLTNLQDRCAQLEKEKEDALRDEQTKLATLQERCAQLQEEKEDALRDKQTILTNLQERCAQLEEEKEDALRDKQTKLTNLQELCAQLEKEKDAIQKQSDELQESHMLYQKSHEHLQGGLAQPAEFTKPLNLEKHSQLEREKESQKQSEAAPAVLRPQLQLQPPRTEVSEAGDMKPNVEGKRTLTGPFAESEPAAGPFVPESRELFTLCFQDPLGGSVEFGMPGFQKAIREALKKRPAMPGEPAWVWAYLEELASEERDSMDAIHHFAEQSVEEKSDFRSPKASKTRPACSSSSSSSSSNPRKMASLKPSSPSAPQNPATPSETTSPAPKSALKRKRLSEGQEQDFPAPASARPTEPAPKRPKDESEDKHEEHEVPERKLYSLCLHDPHTQRPLFFGMQGFSAAARQLLQARPANGEPAWFWAQLEELTRD